MFVMRAKVKLSDATEHYELRGFLGEAAEQACPALISEPAWRASTEGEHSFIKLHSARNSNISVSRLLWVGIKDHPNTQAFVSQSIPTVGESDWQLAEVLSGISMVQTATSEAFVPQMLNYESVEGVSFKKGCYPGQEVVARSQFRGTLKRRAYIVSSQGPLQVGQEVFTADEAEQACGTVASAATSANGAAWWGIVSMQISATTQSLHLGNTKGPQLLVKALPYPLLEDI
jgi:folate-binding protein YgfZ